MKMTYLLLIFLWTINSLIPVYGKKPFTLTSKYGTYTATPTPDGKSKVEVLLTDLPAKA